MKRKELKNLAKKIAELEITIQNSNDENEIAYCKQEIICLTGRVMNFEDIVLLDEMIQEILEK